MNEDKRPMSDDESTGASTSGETNTPEYEPYTNEPRTDQSAEMPSQDAAAQSQSDTPAGSDTSADGKNSMMTIAVIIIVLALIGIGWYFYSAGGGGGNLIPGSGSATNDTGGANVVGSRTYPEVVAVVNGQEVTRDEFAEAVSNYGQQAQAQGVDLSSEENQEMVEQQALTTLVNTILIKQAAEDAGVEVSEEAIEAELSGLRDQLGGQENFDARLEAMGLTEAEVRADVAEQLLINQYLESLSGMDEIEVTEEEIQQFYDELAAGGQELPPLEELAPRIEAQLSGQERQTIIQGVVDALREDAEIERNI